MNCTRCGNWNADGEATCRFCGTALTAGAAMPAAPPTPLAAVPPPPPRQALFQHDLLVRILLVAAVVLTIGGLLFPWWGQENDVVNGGRHQRSSYSFGIMGGYFGGGGSSVSGPSFYNSGNVDSLITAVSLLLVIGFLSLLTGCYLIRKRRKGETIGRGVVRWLILLALVLILLAPVAFAVGYSGARKQDILDSQGSFTDPGHPTPDTAFLGSWTESAGGGSTLFQRWGPDIGWVSALLAGLSLLLVMFLDAKSRGEEQIVR